MIYGRRWNNLQFEEDVFVKNVQGTAKTCLG